MKLDNRTDIDQLRDINERPTSMAFTLSEADSPNICSSATKGLGTCVITYRHLSSFLND